jgi:two-component system sensor histidine kinase YesM
MHLLNYLKRRKIQTRISALFLILMVFSIILLTSFLYQIAARIVQQRTAETLSITLRNIDDSLKTVMQDMTQSAKLLIASSDVQLINTLSAPVSGHTETQRFIRIQKLCSSILAAKPQITELVLYTADGKRVLTTRLYLRSSGDQDWDLDLLHGLDAATVGLSYVTGNENSLIHMAMVIRNLNDFSKIGYALFGINRNVFSSDLKEQIDSLHGNAYIVTKDQSVVTAVRNISFENEQEVIQSCLQQTTDDAPYHSVHLESEPFFTVTHRMDAQDWTLLLVVPQNVITADLRYMSYASIAIAVATACISWLLTLFISSGISRPIIQVADAMKQFEQGDFSVRCQEPAEQLCEPAKNVNEIAYLSSSFNRMIEQLDHTINQNYKLQLLEKDMEVRLLQAQLDPHFLYNTLDNIYYLAKEHGAQDISDIVLALCSLSRASIIQTESLVSIADDLSFAKDYLRIMQLRFGRKLAVDFQLEDAVLACQIPKLTLQPLIANAIQHGLEPQPGAWRIFVSARIQDEAVVLCVCDNGVGISPERLEEIRQFMVNEDDHYAHIGLCALSRRLRLLLGERASLSVTSDRGQGTSVLLTLPITKREE